MKTLQEIIKEFGIEELVEIVYENGTFDVEECEKGGKIYEYYNWFW